MAANPLDRTKLTFSQADGLEPLPSPLRLGEVAHEMRFNIWKVLDGDLRKHSYSEQLNWSTYRYITSPWSDIMKDHYILQGEPPHSYSTELDINSRMLSKILFESGWNKVFDFLQFIMRHEYCPDVLIENLRAAFMQSRAAYDIIDEGPTIIPSATPEEGLAISTAMRDLDDSPFTGARTHLRQAVDELNRGNYAASVRESIHGVESVARQIDPGASSTLTPALRALESKTRIHPALRQAYEKLYGYSSDEQGIRHALLQNESPDLDMTDAVFMFGACASFISYLVNKARTAGLLER